MCDVVVKDGLVPNQKASGAVGARNLEGPRSCPRVESGAPEFKSILRIHCSTRS